MDSDNIVQHLIRIEGILMTMSTKVEQSKVDLESLSVRAALLERYTGWLEGSFKILTVVAVSLTIAKVFF